MAGTLGTLCDKPPILKLKQWHSDEPARLESLKAQEEQLRGEIDGFVSAAVSGEIPASRLTFAANKVYKREGNAVARVEGTIGQAFGQLAQVNCALWHEQEKVYEFEKVAADAKDAVVKQLALLNLQRNECIDRIDRALREAVESTGRQTGSQG